MKITLIGYGRMGHAIEQVAHSRGHEIVGRIDKDDQASIPSETDVVIDFSTPDSAYNNIRRAIESGFPVVSGTTGWTDRMEEIREQVREREGAFFYSSNFSIGVFLFRHLVREAAKLINNLPQYSDVQMEEVHHVHKLDYPSGTALTVAGDIISEMDRYRDTRAYLGNAEKPTLAEDQLLIHSLREGEVPGIHRVAFSSPQDVIRLEHEAFGREGFAMGAVMAAEFLQGKKGWYGMEDMLHFDK